MRKLSLLAFVAMAGLAIAGAGCGGTSSTATGGGNDGGNGSDGGMTVTCGDGIFTSPETCDDGNANPNDGCSATCQIEPGWVCPTPGAPCIAAKCGDGIVAGDETCDDGNAKANDGCSSACQIEPQDEDGNSWLCATPGQPCAKTKCGDGTVEGNEQCDDGNDRPFDGCYKCRIEPSCQNGTCTSVCGDGIIFPGAEACDDGNNRSGDGCSADCKLEDPKVTGYTCTNVTEDLPDSIDVPIILRDFLGSPETPPTGAAVHPDFQNYNCGLATGLVQSTLKDGRPAFLSDHGSLTCQQLTDAAHFAQWYTDDAKDATGNLFNKTVVSSVQLTHITGTTTYEYNSDNNPRGNTTNTTRLGFFPLDDFPLPASWGITPDTSGFNHDYGFTTELRYWFTYEGGETLNFSGDDDVWVFINGKLAVDLGGVHGRQVGSITLTLSADGQSDAAGLGLEKGKVYEMALFHAERHTTQSNFWLTLGGFVKATTKCVSVCGDGIKAPDEECDDGPNNGTQGDVCSADCKLVGAM